MKMQGLFLGFILTVIHVFLTCCEKDEVEDIQPPDCKIITPADSSKFQIGDTIIIDVEASDPDGLINSVLFYIDDVGKFSTKVLPYQFKWSTSNETVGFHIISVTAIDRGNNSSSDKCIINLVIKPPVVITDSVSSITNNSAVSGGNVTNDGGASVTARGVCWSTSPDPTLANSYTTDGHGTGLFTSNITGLSTGTTYYVKAYATNVEDTAYGDTVSFTTAVTITLPSVTTTSITSITEKSAQSGGNVTSDGGATVTARGVCWSTSENPTLNNAKGYTTDSVGPGSYTSSLTGLSRVTTYYVRAYATNSEGTSYGNQVSFTTNADLPVVSTTSVSSVTTGSVQCGGNVTDDGGASVTARGVCWSTSSDPTVSDYKTIDGNGIGLFTSSITELEKGTTYYVRAYATNSEGTSYGNQVSFTTNADLPVASTTSVSSITTSSAQCGGNVTSDGGASVTARGVCWNTSSDPTVSDYKTTDGNGIGSFTSSITELEKGTTYYVRAYATNSAGTGYGNQISFATRQEITIPVVTTIAISSITTSSAQCGGNVTDDGGASVTARGVCWSTSENPSPLDNCTIDGSGTGSFSSNITGLSPGTTYYVRSYATNIEGTAYGLQYNFFTNWDNSTISDYDGNVYSTLQIGGQVWMGKNLKTTRYNDGANIPLVTDKTEWSNLSTPAYCWYNNDSVAYANPYGALYNWYVVDNLSNGDKNVCPAGWHVPTDAEWTTLTDYLGGESLAGGKLKETDTTNWNSPNTGATNETGFTALPGGMRYKDGAFVSIGYYGLWWSSTGYDTDYPWGRDMRSKYSDVSRIKGYKQNGFSVRCIKD